MIYITNNVFYRWERHSIVCRTITINMILLFSSNLYTIYCHGGSWNYLISYHIQGSYTGTSAPCSTVGSPNDFWTANDRLISGRRSPSLSTSMSSITKKKKRVFTSQSNRFVDRSFFYLLRARTHSTCIFCIIYYYIVVVQLLQANRVTCTFVHVV